MKRINVIIFGIALLFLSGCGPNEYKAERSFWKAMDYYVKELGAPDASAEKYEQARRNFRQIVEEYPDWRNIPQALYIIGKLYAAEGRFEKAREVFEGILTKYKSLNRLSSEVLFSSALTYEKEGNWDEAFKKFKRIEKDYPDTSRALQAPLYVAEYYRRIDNLEEAEIAYENAVVKYKKIISVKGEMSSLSVAARNFLVMLYLSRQMWDNAVEGLWALADKYPRSPVGAEALYRIGSIYETRIFDKQRAISAYREFVKRYPKHKLTESMNKHIEELVK